MPAHPAVETIPAAGVMQQRIAASQEALAYHAWQQMGAILTQHQGERIDATGLTVILGVTSGRAVESDLPTPLGNFSPLMISSLVDAIFPGTRLAREVDQIVSAVLGIPPADAGEIGGL